jgi:hypothetical protein
VVPEKGRVGGRAGGWRVLHAFRGSLQHGEARVLAGGNPTRQEMSQLLTGPEPRLLPNPRVRE